MRLFCFAVAAVFLAASGEAFDCKNNGCPSPTQHTLCKFTNPNPAPACGSVKSVGFTDQEKNEMVKAHNDLRQYVAAGKEKRGKPGPQPSASNMKMMKWDDAVATVAQRWANQCNFGHDKCRNDSRWPSFYVGQNAAMTMSTAYPNTTPKDIAQMWYDEVSQLDRNQVHKLTNIGGAGHYTQLVWADSDTLGCGKIVYNDGGRWTKYYVVCNYGPGGNVMGTPIYAAKN